MAALNQPPIGGGRRAVRSRARRDVRLRAVGLRRSALPVTPLDEMYALPAARYIESRGGEVRVHARGTACSSSGDGSSAVDVRGEEIQATDVIAPCRGSSLSTLFDGDPNPRSPRLSPTRRAWSRSQS